jgi:hypothetical protein
MNEPACPELEKMKTISIKSQVIGEFIDWLGTEQMCVAQWGADDPLYPELHPVRLSIEKLLAKYFSIDLNKVDKEKRALLDYVRSLNEPTPAGK